MPTTSIHVFGGARGIGRWFVEQVFRPTGLPVTVYDIDLPADPPAAPNVTTRQIRYREGRITGVPTFAPNAAIILAVPISALRSTCAALFPLLPDGCLVADMSSVKVEPHAIMAEYAGGRLAILGMHPLFGPLVASPIGQIVVLTGFAPEDARHAWMADTLKECGCLVQHLPPELHDEYMLYVQVLTHFLLLTFARVLVQNRHSIAALLSVRTPPFMFLSAFAGRLLGSNALTYANIQRLRGAEQLRVAVLHAAQDLHQRLGPERDLATAVGAIQELGEPFSGTEIAECFAISSKAIGSVQQIEQRLFDLAATGQVCGLQRADTSRVYIGVVRAVTADRVLFEERTRQMPDGRYALYSNAQTQQNYARMGIAFGRLKQFELLKRNLRILPEEELQAWITANVLLVQRDINVAAAGLLAPAFYERYLPKLISDVVNIRFVEFYQPDVGAGRVTLTVTHRPEVATDEIIARVTDLVRECVREV